MSSRLTLAVVIPNYNHAAYLPRCLDSVLLQSRPPDEVVVVDDGSTDESLTVLADYARRFPQVQVHRNERNLGPVGAFLAASARVTAEFSTPLAADDYMRPGFFEAAMAMLEAHPHAEVLFCDLAKVDRRGQALEVSRLDHPGGYIPPQELADRVARTGFNIMGVHAIFRHRHFSDPGLLVPELRWVFDWLFSAVLAFRHGICYVPGTYKCMEIRRDSYHHVGHRDRAERARVVRLALAQLERPDLADVAPLIRRSGNLELLGTGGLDLMLREPRYWKYLSLPHLRRQLRPWLRERLATALPGLRNLYRRVFPNRYEI